MYLVWVGIPSPRCFRELEASVSCPPPPPCSHQEIAILGSKPVGALKFYSPGHCFLPVRAAAPRSSSVQLTLVWRSQLLKKSKVWQIESAGICGHLGQFKLVGGLSSSACFLVTLHGSTHSVYFLLPQCSPWLKGRSEVIPMWNLQV